MGAAGRDFHNFRTFFAAHPEFRVCAFTAAQIPFIAQRRFPRELAPQGYDSDIPIHDESELPGLIKTLAIDFVFFSYSDVAHTEVMHRASIVQAAGAGFILLGPMQTSLTSRCKVVAVTATRTGTGKSPLTQWLARSLVDSGVRVATMRHPMPYGNLRAQAVQRFATLADLDLQDCTIEEREEYEPYVRQGLVIFAGVDYAAILQAAEAEADLILWDGGNNDFSFVRPDLNIVVCDALRAGHGLDYYPGETNFRAADIVVINKTGQASAADIDRIVQLKARINPAAGLLTADLEVSVDEPERIRGKRVLIVEDGPTVTHGGMGYGAGWVAAHKYGVGEVVDPRPCAVGSLAETFAAYPQLLSVLPAMGYSQQQRRELKATIENAGADLVLNASPANVGAVLELTLPVVQVSYRFAPGSGEDLLARVGQLLS
jgi:predicted GTPase